MTLASPTLLTTIIKKVISFAINIDRKYQEVSSKISRKILTWIFYVPAPIIWTLILCGSEILQGILFSPKYVWDLFLHLDGRSIFRML